MKERPMANEMASDNGIRDAALGWAVRAGDPAFADWEAFTLWLEADPAHARAYQPAAEVDFSGRRSARPRRHDDKQDTGFGCDLADEGEDQRVFGLSNEQKRL
ncbi:FecR/PupR family sigma factor regulator [Novosphingobium resinovorum]|uniref:FecR/PupR family sigma factor regulator n=1 Tax=Novosphingobium resinovorum TaxID=158500 RepID=UPI003D2A1F0F